MPVDASSRADVLARVCGALNESSIERARSIVEAEYPFTALYNAGRTYTDAQQMRVFVRDGFVDRYSGARLVFPGTLKLVSRLLPAEFPYHPNWKMSAGHVAYWDLCPTLDHVAPVARGGADDESNWVTTSMLRNSAKSNWTLDVLGWELRPPEPDRGWDGLVGFCREYVRAHPEHLSDKYVARWLKAAATTIDRT